MKIKYEGYWRQRQDDTDSPYPWPVPEMLNQEYADNYYELIKRAESFAKFVRYRGSSVSRINGSMVGSGEYSLLDPERGSVEWRWPENYAEHYVRDNRCRPTLDFITFIRKYTEYWSPTPTPKYKEDPKDVEYRFEFDLSQHHLRIKEPKYVVAKSANKACNILNNELGLYPSDMIMSTLVYPYHIKSKEKLK